MNILLNPAWPEAEKRWQAFWQREMLDRPCLQIYAPAALFATEPTDQAPVPGTPDSEARAFFVASQERYRRTAYLGEAFPLVYYSWEGIALMLGARVEESEGTLWVKPYANSLGDIDLSRVRPDSPEVERMLAVVSYCATAGAGECFVGHPMHLGNPGDTLAKLRGYANLCLDLYDDPARVFDLEMGLAGIWIDLYERVYQSINRHMGGSCGWLPAWDSGRSVLLEFDFCDLISPELFKRYIPCLMARSAAGDHTIFHLDGPGALKHLDALLELPEIHAIQAQPGSGVADTLSWLPVMQKIQRAGKSLYVGPTCSAEETMVLLRELDPEGLAIPVAVESIPEGLALMETVEKMYG